MTSTRVPGIFVRSQLSRIPGEERKFRRRTIVAFVPDWMREREAAASQAVSIAGVSGRGVDVVSIAGVGVARSVAVGEGRGSVGTGSGVPVAEGSGADVDEIAGLTLAVGEKAGAAVVRVSPVSVRDPTGLSVDVGRMDMDSVGLDVKSAVRVGGELEDIDSAAGSTVEDGAKACGVVRLRR